MIREYQILSDTIVEDLSLQVNKAITEGWQPFGSLAVVYRVSSGSIRYCQPMVKEGIK